VLTRSVVYKLNRRGPNIDLNGRCRHESMTRLQIRRYIRATLARQHVNQTGSLNLASAVVDGVEGGCQIIASSKQYAIVDLRHDRLTALQPMAINECIHVISCDLSSIAHGLSQDTRVIARYQTTYMHDSNSHTLHCNNRLKI